MMPSMPASPASPRPHPRSAPAELWSILLSAFRVRRDPVPFCRQVSGRVVRYLSRQSVSLAGARALDAGAGGGALAEALAAAGAHVVGLDVQDHWHPALEHARFVIGRAERLPFAAGAFDLVVSSNVLEHVPEPWTMVEELVRVCRPGGHVWISWTNWLSPIGGHEMSPFHYLGPRLGSRAYRAVRRRDPRWNVPGKTLFVVHVGDALRRFRAGRWEVVDVAPRYWPSLRLLARVPGLREVAMWNCTVLLRKPALRPEPAAAGGASTGGTRPAS